MTGPDAHRKIQEAFTRVLTEITEANRVGAPANDIHELYQHAAELLDIVEEEIWNEPPEAQKDVGSASRSRSGAYRRLTVLLLAAREAKARKRAA